jgi:adenosylhomocysteine nucleosidase
VLCLHVPCGVVSGQCAKGIARSGEQPSRLLQTIEPIIAVSESFCGFGRFLVILPLYGIETVPHHPPPGDRPLIGVIMATLLEAEPFIEALGMEKVRERLLTVYRRGETILIISGIGKVNAAVATTFCCSVFDPEWILNLGAAGATKPSHRLGEIYHITKVVEYDRPLLRSDGPHIHTPEVFPGFREATLATQDKAVIKADPRRQVSSVADLVDMEGSAVVQAGRRFGTRCLLFKFVSDTPDLPSGHGDIVGCIRQYGKPFCDFIAASVMPILSRNHG